jgi:hypothetical protein
MKYSKQSVFFQRLRVDAHLRQVGAHLSVATVERQDKGPPSSDQRLALSGVSSIG